MSRPTRTHTTRLVSGLSFAFFLFLALILLCPPAVSAEDKKSEYGTVIGIGTCSSPLLLSTQLTPLIRLGNNVRAYLGSNDDDALPASFRLVILVLREPISLSKGHVDVFNPIVPSVQRGGRVEIIANDQGHRITPSWVSFTDEERL